MSVAKAENGLRVSAGLTRCFVTLAAVVPVGIERVDQVGTAAQNFIVYRGCGYDTADATRFRFTYAEQTDDVAAVAMKRQRARRLRSAQLGVFDFLSFVFHAREELAAAALR